MATDAPALLRVPAAEPAHFSRNFIRLAVCELRFPTLLELESRAPAAFQKAIRREYPSYDRDTDLNLNAAGAESSTVHRFTSKNRRWVTAMRQASLALETSHYDSFDAFLERLNFVVESALSTIDSDFFTRVGLRYINAIARPQHEIAGWVNPSLVGALADGTFGTVAQYLHQVQGKTEIGGYIFRHGTSKNPQNGEPEYTLDFDFYSEMVEATAVSNLVKDLHARTYSFFAWTLGPKAWEHLDASAR